MSLSPNLDFYRRGVRLKPRLEAAPLAPDPLQPRQAAPLTPELPPEYQDLLRQIEQEPRLPAPLAPQSRGRRLLNSAAVGLAAGMYGPEAGMAYRQRLEGPDPREVQAAADEEAQRQQKIQNRIAALRLRKELMPEPLTPKGFGSSALGIYSQETGEVTTRAPQPAARPTTLSPGAGLVPEGATEPTYTQPFAPTRPEARKLLTPEEEAQQIRLRAAGRTGVEGPGVPVSPPGTPPAEILAKYPANVQQKAQRLLEYDVDLSPYMLSRNPEWAAAADAASEIDSTWSATEYPSRLKLKAEFKTGNASRNVRSLNTLIGHIETLQDAADKLDNSGWQTWNSIVNRYRTEFDDPRVSNFNKAALAVSSESATAFKGATGTDQEMKKWKDEIYPAQGPNQIREGNEILWSLIGSRLDALTDQYETGMGKPKDFRLLSDKSRKILQKLGIGDLEQAAAQPQGGGAGIQDKPPDDLPALKPGQKATDPDTGEVWENRGGKIMRAN